MPDVQDVCYVSPVAVMTPQVENCYSTQSTGVSLPRLSPRYHHSPTASRNS